MRPINLARLSPLRRAYLLGYRHGLNRAQAKMQAKVDCWEAEFVALQDDFETLLNEMRSAKDARAVQEAVSERAMIEDGWLN